MFWCPHGLVHWPAHLRTENQALIIENTSCLPLFTYMSSGVRSDSPAMRNRNFIAARHIIMSQEEEGGALPFTNDVQIGKGSFGEVFSGKLTQV